MATEPTTGRPGQRGVHDPVCVVEQSAFGRHPVGGAQLGEPLGVHLGVDLASRVASPGIVDVVDELAYDYDDTPDLRCHYVFDAEV
jgi:hypothetical protein